MSFQSYLWLISKLVQFVTNWLIDPEIIDAALFYTKTKNDLYSLSFFFFFSYLTGNSRFVLFDKNIN